MELGTIDPDQEQKAPMLANQAPNPHGGAGFGLDTSYGGHGDSLPYQHNIGSNGGDLGVASYDSNVHPAYRGTSASPATPVTAGGRLIPGSGSPYGGAAGYGQPQRPALDSGYDSYGAGQTASHFNAGPQQQYHEVAAPQQSHHPGALSAGPAQPPQQGGYQAYQGQGGYRDV